ncbi:DUF4189 domain-containing protein [Mycolicibacterium frederiksbergense]|uniref:DUF4189 domain-containing protein n=1 Tax=Mycolicibacterium frederiksbergense TaxID=117567 RepID=A0A6H0S2E4_9MYCO|nr:DUF4189 domain-containing protein [Mycolicibacterium frederiksbergense]
MYVDPNNLSTCLAATPGNDYVALAASPGLPTAGAAYGGAASQGEADRIAMAQCVAGTNSTCEIIARAYHACAAIALAPDGSMVSGVGPDPNAAATAAMNAAPRRASARRTLLGAPWKLDATTSPSCTRPSAPRLGTQTCVDDLFRQAV